MSTTQPTTDETLTDRLIRFFTERYRNAIGTLAQRFPNEQESLVVDYDDLYEWDLNVAEDLLDHPGEITEYLEEALRLVDLPADVSLSNAHVRVTNLPDHHTYYPGEFSPTDHAGNYRAITGEVSKSSDVYSKITEAAFECQRCGVMTHVPQTDKTFQEPHECHGCERQGPFGIDFDQSAFIDAQVLRIQTPPEIADGAGQELDVFLERDLTDVATVGDRVTITGTLHLEQKTKGSTKTGKFKPYLDAHHVDIDQTDHTDIDITPDERDLIHELSDGAKGNPLDVAAQSLAPKIHGYPDIKRMLILGVVGGSKVEYGNGDHDRGEFHILLLGDPGTAKSKLLQRIEELGWRTVGVSGKGATVAGVTASAKQDDFGDGDVSLAAGAFVKAHKGAVCLDELDDMPSDVRAAMLDPMSKQTIHVNKWGINTTLRTEAAVIAAGNPKYGRFDPYEPLPDQFDLESNLLSRFDLVYTLTDRQDPDRDADVASHIISARDAGKRKMNGQALDDEATEAIETPVDQDLLRKWIALAKQQPEPVFANDEIRKSLQESFTRLRGANGYAETDPVPVTFRKLEGILRVAEAAAKFEFSETIDQRHVDIATKAVGQSIQDVSTDEDGTLDADVQETGTSMSQKQEIKRLAATIEELQPKQGGAPIDEVIDALEEQGIETAETLISKVKQEGLAYQKTPDEIRWVGGA